MTSLPDLQSQYTKASLRAPDEVMRLQRMGSFFPTRLSFMRTLLRRLSSERAMVSRPVWQINEEGYGRAVYSVTLGAHVYSLVAFSTPLDPEKRTDRVIAEAWDTSYVLFDGVPSSDDIKRLEANVPKQEAGRCLASDLVLSRANKSLRLFDYVVDCLAAGVQPDIRKIDDTGYLMRTTAVYGNGKFGIADRARIMDRSGVSGSFQAEMLTVWMIRGFTHDLVEHVAHSKGGEQAVLLDPEIKRHLGVGNSTGLGMAPFLVSHPILINNWMLVRETALARVRGVEYTDSQTLDDVKNLIKRVGRHLEQWNVADERQMDRIKLLRKEWLAVTALATSDYLSKRYPWDRLIDASDQWSLECQELLVGLVLEPHGALIDDLDEFMMSSSEPRLEPAMTIGALRALIVSLFSWALEIDFERPQNVSRFWYVSQEKLEPRLGNRHEEPGADLEMPLDIARRVKALYLSLDGVDDNQSVAEFLLRHPDHRYATKRIQTLACFPYAEIRDNLIGEECLPIDMLRCKLSFFGASKFDPKSDRWTRITLYQGAPLFQDVHNGCADDWWLPAFDMA